MYVLCLINNSFLVVKTFKGLPCISSGLHCLSTDLILLTHRDLPPHCKLVPTGLNLGTKPCPILCFPLLFPGYCSVPQWSPSSPEKGARSSQILVGGGRGCMHPFGVQPSTAVSFPNCSWHFHYDLLGLSLLSSHPSFLFDPHPYSSW